MSTYLGWLAAFLVAVFLTGGADMFIKDDVGGEERSDVVMNGRRGQVMVVGGGGPRGG